jgi:hypothetical protein
MAGSTRSSVPVRKRQASIAQSASGDAYNTRELQSWLRKGALKVWGRRDS